MWFHRNGAPAGAAATLPQIADQFLTSVELCARRLVSIEIAYETDAERDVVQIIAVNMAAVDLTSPSIPDFDLAIAGGCAVPDNEVIGETVLHAANMLVVIIKHTGIALPRAAIVHDNELPTTPFHRRPPDRFDHRTC